MAWAADGGRGAGLGGVLSCESMHGRPDIFHFIFSSSVFALARICIHHIEAQAFWIKAT